MVQSDGGWNFRAYAGNLKTRNDVEGIIECQWKCIIPFDKFNPNNIVESLKYNIVKK